MNIVITIEEGTVQSVLTDEEARVIVIDRDTDGIDDEELSLIQGEQAYLYAGITSAQKDVELVAAIIKEVDQHE